MTDDTPDLLELLDDVSASLETVLLHQGKQMTPSDYAARKKLVAQARAVVSAKRADVGDIHPVDAKEWYVDIHTHMPPAGMPRAKPTKAYHIVHLWDEKTDGDHVETHTDEICELVMDYGGDTVRHHASILAGSLRVLKAAESLLKYASEYALLRELLCVHAPAQFQEIADAVKVSRTPAHPITE